MYEHYCDKFVMAAFDVVEEILKVTIHGIRYGRCISDISDGLKTRISVLKSLVDMFTDALHGNIKVEEDPKYMSFKLSERDYDVIMHMFHTALPQYQDKEMRAAEADLIERLCTERNEKVQRGEW